MAKVLKDLFYGDLSLSDRSMPKGSAMHKLSTKLCKCEETLTDKLRRSIEDYRAVELTEDSRMTLAEWLDRWLEEYAAPTVRPSTLAGYRQYIDGYIKPRLGEKRISKVTAEGVRRLYRELQKEGRLAEHPDYGRRLSGSTIRNIHGVLHQAMDAGMTTVRSSLLPRILPQSPRAYIQAYLSLLE